MAGHSDKPFRVIELPVPYGNSAGCFEWALVGPDETVWHQSYARAPLDKLARKYMHVWELAYDRGLREERHLRPLGAFDR